MASANHVNYWNYLETVTANRNREYETNRHNEITEGLDLAKTDSQVALNKTQELVNEANALKIKADTQVSYANAEKIAADRIVSLETAKKLRQDVEASKQGIVLQQGRLDMDRKALDFEIEKFGKEYLIDEFDANTRRGNLALGISKLKQELIMHNDKMIQADFDRIQKAEAALLDAGVKADKNTIDLLKVFVDAVMGLG